jgi:hypothetical protein
MTNRVISQAAIWIFLGIVLIVWYGCGDSDDSSVDKPTATKDSSTDDTSADNPPSIVADASTDNANVNPPPMVVDAPTDNVSVGNPRTIVDAPTDNTNVDPPPAVEDSPVDTTDVDPPPKEDAPADDVIVEVVVGSLQGQVAQIEDVLIHIRVLQNGAAVASTQANLDGSYQIDDIKLGTYIVQIAAEDHKVVERTVQVRAGEVSVLDNVVLEALAPPLTHIRGLVLDQQTNAPLDGIRIQLIDEAGGVRDVLTKQTGGFEFENVPTDQEFTLIIDIPECEKQKITVDPIPAGEVAKLELELAPIEIEALPIGDGLQIGMAAPAFNLPDQNGKRRALTDYVGQKVVLAFDRGRW